VEIENGLSMQVPVLEHAQSSAIRKVHITFGSGHRINARRNRSQVKEVWVFFSADEAGARRAQGDSTD
jgi:hypothetical protein